MFTVNFRSANNVLYFIYHDVIFFLLFLIIVQFNFICIMFCRLLTMDKVV